MKKILISVIFALQVVALLGQDIHFSQYNEAPLMVNPALSGYFEGVHRISLNYKNQWRSLGGAYNTYALSYDLPITSTSKNKSGYMALGVNFYNDIAGDLKLGNLIGKLSLAYHLRMNEEHNLSAGIYGGFGQFSTTFSNAKWGNQYNGSSGFDANMPSNETFANESFAYPDFGFGMNWSMITNSRTMTSNDGVKANAGFAIHHVNTPNYKFLSNSDAKLKMRISLHARALIGIGNSNSAIIPQLLVQIQGKQKEIVPGLLGRFMLKEASKYTGFINDSYLSFGGYMRTKDAIIAHALLEFNDFALGLSYDINVSKLTSATNGRGGFEIMLRYVVKEKTLFGKSMY